MKGILGRKIGMTQVFTESGKLIPVTVVAENEPVAAPAEEVEEAPVVEEATVEEPEVEAPAEEEAPAEA